MPDSRETGRRNFPSQTVVGITGGIGSGKTRVCGYLAEKYTLPLIDLDAICRQLLLPKAPGWSALKNLLPAHFFTESDKLDRTCFRQAIFADSALRHRVDALLHPLARQEMAEQISGQSSPVILAEIPLLIEAGWQDTVDLIVVVYAAVRVRLRRIVRRDQVTEEQARMAVNAQKCLFGKAVSADHVIDNSKDWKSTVSQLHQLVPHLLQR